MLASKVGLGASQLAQARQLVSMDIYPHCSASWESQVEVQKRQLLMGESLLPGLHTATFLLCPHKTERQLLGGSSCRIQILSDWDPTLMTSFNFYYFPRGTSSKHSHTGS